MSHLVAAILVVLNLGLIFVLLAAPLGVRTVRLGKVVKADGARLWSALWPLGQNALWSGEYVSAQAVEGGPALVRLKLGWEGRDGLPIERMVRLEDVVEGERFAMRVVDDSSLDPAFWSHYRETVEIAPALEGVRVLLTRTDRYRGLAVLAFRYFAMRRQLGKLKIWAETGRFRAGGLFEHPASQIGFAVLSAFLLWPVFGLTLGGLAIASVLTAVVALHEIGHMAAFRLMGHRRVRMIFVPLLGGIALGGRPYDSRFEVAFVALMGAGFSAFLVPLAIAASLYAAGEGWRAPAALLGTLAGCLALFNVANLVPVWKFDGGQVLRQLCPGPYTLAVASFALLSAFLLLGFKAGFPAPLLLAAGAIFAALSLMTAGGGVRPRHELKPIGNGERIAIAGALAAVFAIHASGLLWASDRLREFRTYDRMRQERLERAPIRAAMLPAVEHSLTKPERPSHGPN